MGVPRHLRDHPAAEPLLVRGVVVGFVAAGLTFGAAFGLDLTPGQAGSVLGFVEAALGVAVLWSRRAVYSPRTVRNLVSDAEDGDL